jgi:ParB family chromosome partitioning protein
MAGNKGFGDMLADGYDKDSAAPARPTLPTDSVLASRSSTLAELASGKIVTERILWVPADRCRPWAYHNRDQSLLNEESCTDLIDSFKSEGRQRLPAIVRRLKDNPDFDFEIIAGVRRHWTVSWLNAHNYPDFEFLVNVQTLTDEEAFRLADVENRARKDLTDLERARDYLQALDLFYGGKQNEMAERLNVAPAWLSRLLDLARLPEVVLAAFGDLRVLRVEHAKQLAPILRAGSGAKRVLAAAEELAATQASAKSANENILRAPDVVRQLLKATTVAVPKAKPAASEVRLSAARRPMLKSERRRGGGVKLELLAGSGATRAELVAAFTALLDGYPGNEPFG